MGRARADFFKSIDIMQQLSINPMLTDVLPVSSAHNEQARILRNGLVVSAFSALESYLEDNLEEMIGELGRSSLSYTSFGEPLRRFLTVDALQGFANRCSLLPEAEKLSYVESNLQKFLSHLGQGRRYGAFGFSPKGSNVGEGDLTRLLKALGWTGGWTTIGQIANAVGGGFLSIDSNFRNFQQDRHRSAHISSHNTATADLQTHLQTARSVGIAIDLAAHLSFYVLKTASNFNAAVSQINIGRLRVRFLDQSGANWREILNGNLIKVHNDFAQAKAISSKRRTREPVVVRNAQLLPVELI